VASTDPLEYTRVFGKVTLAELRYILGRRQSLGISLTEVARETERIASELDQLKAEKKDPDFDKVPEAEPRPLIRPGPRAGLVGLAFSGGGIRSATFNLGLLQSLARHNILRYCDYLSTVSGGGYIGSCLSSLLDDPNNSVERDRFPFRPGGGEVPDERKELKWLREHSNYLAIDTSYFGRDVWRMIGMYVSGLVLTNLVPFAVILLALYIIPRLPQFIPAIPTEPLEGARLLSWAALAVFCIMIVARFAFALRNLDMKGRILREYLQAALAGIVAALIALAGFLIALDFWPHFELAVDRFLQSASVVSIIGVIVGGLKSEHKVIQRILSGILRTALAILLIVVFAALLRWLASSNQFDATFSVFGADVPVPILIAAVLFLISEMVNTNRITLHHFYRDRLSEAYVIKRDPKSDLIISNEKLTLAQLHAHTNGAPYHLINATLNIPDTRDRYLRGRRADFFLFSKYFCGADSTGYRRSDRYEGGKTHLASALAISGAAASPRMGTSSKSFIAFAMTLLNLRLNRWMLNPSLPSLPKSLFVWPYYFLKELFGKSKETDWLLSISDGGHHENLGIYALVRRGCRYIIASDAGADPTSAMEDLGNVMRKLRVDFSIDIEIDLAGLRPELLTRTTPLHYAVGRIKYPGDVDGILLYIKASVTGTEPEDLLTFRRENPEFPHQTTSDQFFDEGQFESYRKLGELIGNGLFDESSGSEAKDVSAAAFIPRLFESLHDRYQRWCAGVNGKSRTEQQTRSSAPAQI
jgi:Patatin-like phospholipase